jgi:N-acetylglucosamine-6-phosphate deacetylase
MTGNGDFRPEAILAQSIFDGEALRGPALLRLSDGVIRSVEPAPSIPPAGTLRLPADAILAPGFIDIQVNGGGGVLLNDDPSPAAIARIVSAHRRFGATGLLPTLITDEPAKLRRLAAIAGEAMKIPGVLGFHLEGPFLNSARKGIHPVEHLRAPTNEDLSLLKALARHGRLLVTLAPECVAPRFIHDLAAAGARIAAGHSEASAAEMDAAVKAGIIGVTHLFNAMSQMSGRAPGVVGAALAEDRLFAGVICDGIHVDPVSLRAAFRAKGAAQLMLVTDAMPTVGSRARRFLLHGREITLKGGALRGPDGTLGGAHLTMAEAVRNAVTMMGARLEDALTMASATPARFLGLGDRLGAIAPGYRAALVGLRRENMTVVGVSVDGVWEEF